MSKKIKQGLFLKIPYSEILYWLLGFTLPLQLAKHFWPSFSYLYGMRIDYLSPALYLTDLVIIAVLILKLINFRWAIVKIKILPVILLIIILIVNFVVASNKWLFGFRLLQYLKIAAMIFLFANINQAQLKAFIKGLGGSTLLALLLAIAQVLNQASLQGFWYFLGERSFTINSPGIATVSLNGHKLLRAYAFFSHPNSLAGFFLPLIFVFLHFKKPLLALGAILLVLLSFSKFIVILLALLLFFWFSPKSKTCRLCRLGQISFALWLVFLSFLFKGDPLSLSSRLNSYQQTLAFIFNHPLGLGLGHYLYTSLPPFNQPVHNVFLLITIEWGWLIWPIIVWCSYQLIKVGNKNRLSILLLITICLTGNFDHYWLTLNQNLLLLGVITGLIIGPWTKRKIPN